MKGKVKFYNQPKGFGFIIGEDQIEYFLHKSQLLNSETLEKDDEVKFDKEHSPKGPQARNVCKLEV